MVESASRKGNSFFFFFENHLILLLCAAQRGILKVCLSLVVCRNRNFRGFHLLSLTTEKDEELFGYQVKAVQS